MGSEIVHVSVDYRVPIPVFWQLATLTHVEGYRDVPPCHEMLDAIQAILSAIAEGCG